MRQLLQKLRVCTNLNALRFRHVLEAAADKSNSDARVTKTTGNHRAYEGDAPLDRPIPPGVVTNRQKAILRDLCIQDWGRMSPVMCFD